MSISKLIYTFPPRSTTFPIVYMFIQKDRQSIGAISSSQERTELNYSLII